MSVLQGFLLTLIKQIVNPLILLLIGAAFVLFAWGMFQFIRNAGDQKTQEQGKQAIFWGIIGLVIIFGAYGIINIALSAFGLPNLSPSSPPTTMSK